MSLAWDQKDIKTVLARHKIKDRATIKKASDAVTSEDGRIEATAAVYEDADDKVYGVLDEIETILIEKNVLSGPKLYEAPDAEDEDDEDDLDDFDDEDDEDDLDDFDDEDDDDDFDEDFSDFNDFDGEDDDLDDDDLDDFDDDDEDDDEDDD